MNTKKLRQKILDLAIHGKLVAQNPNDEPASELLKRINPKAEIISNSDEYGNLPFDIPKNWCWCKLSNISNIYTGNSINENEKKSQYTDVLGTEYIATKDVEFDNSINYKNGISIPEKYIKNFRIAPANSVLMCIEGGSAGRKIGILSQSVCFGNKLCCFSPYANDISSMYIFYYLQSPLFFEIFNSNKNGIIGGVSINNLKKLLFPLPPLEEQKRIVEAIDKWFALIDSIENNKADLETTIKQTKSKILNLAIHGKLVAQNPNDEPASELLKRINPKAEIISNSEQYGKLPFDIPKNWCWCKLSNISNIYTGNSINENEKKSQYTDVLGTEYIATKDVEFDNSINYKNGISIPEKYIKNFRIAPANSVLMCIEGGSAGRKIGILSQSVCFGNKLCCFSPYANDISSMYIFYYLQSPLFFEIFNSNKNGIIGGVSINNLKKLLFPLPPLEEQKRIVEAIDKAFKYLDAIAESL